LFSQHGQQHSTLFLVTNDETTLHHVLIQTSLWPDEWMINANHITPGTSVDFSVSQTLFFFLSETLLKCH
jgi:hypothetical protein